MSILFRCLLALEQTRFHSCKCTDLGRHGEGTVRWWYIAFAVYLTKGWVNSATKDHQSSIQSGDISLASLCSSNDALEIGDLTHVGVVSRSLLLKIGKRGAKFEGQRHWWRATRRTASWEAFFCLRNVNRNLLRGLSLLWSSICASTQPIAQDYTHFICS